MIISFLSLFYLKSIGMEKLSLFIFILLSSFLFSINMYFLDYQIASIILVLSVIDIEKRIIPNEFIIILIMFSLIKLNLSIDFTDILFLVFIIILSILSIKDLGIGMGDIKLILSLFILKGSIYISVLLFFVSISILLFSILTIIKDKNLKRSFPLVPFIFLSFLFIEEFL